MWFLLVLRGQGIWNHALHQQSGEWIFLHILHMTLMLTYLAYFVHILCIFCAYKCTGDKPWGLCIFFAYLCIFNLHIMAYLPWYIFKYILHIWAYKTHIYAYFENANLYIWFCIRVQNIWFLHIWLCIFGHIFVFVCFSIFELIMHYAILVKYAKDMHEICQKYA